jgi:hypothetical protein
MRWTLSAESDAHRDAKQAKPKSEAEESFFETSQAPADDHVEAPTVGQLLFELGVIWAVILGLFLSVQLLLVAYGIPRP